ncbi:MAG: L-ribulose-5-phosphate 4-epimerase [Candidatus Wallacebacter cryptica]|jgi:L-ribulose-5-phosphate 4-epimerase|nr:L-ribulose-5-phosphate 4-epimerase [Bacillota bacterium]
MLTKLRQDVLEANLELNRKGLVVYTWGNVSGIDRERGLVVIKPSGVPYDEMTADQLVVVNLDGEVVEGSLRPSSDLPTHLELYRNFPNIGGVAHTHSTYATGWAQTGMDLPCLGTTHADHFYGAVPCTRPLNQAEVAVDYELNTGKVIVETFADLDPDAVPAVLVSQHGPFTWGKDAMDAVVNSVVLEECAKMAGITFSVNREAQAIPQYLLDKHYLRKHGKDAYYGQN